MKKIIIIIIAMILIILIGLIIYTNDMQMNECLELRVPKLTKRERIELQDNDSFNDEKLIKIYLSKNQAKSMLDIVKNNDNWLHTKIDERLEEKLKFYTREDIYNQLPQMDNIYWIFTNRSNGIKNKHSIDELLEDKMYYAISFGALDVDNNILYYYEYDT